VRILLAGNWRWEHWEAAWTRALQELGHDVAPFSFYDFFNGKLGRYQNALAAIPGPAAIRLNDKLLERVSQIRPDVLFVWRGTHVWPSTLQKIAALGCRLVSYNNDDPFGQFAHGHAPWHHRFLWPWYIKGLKECDVNFVYRPANIPEAVRAGAKNVHLLLPYFVPELHHPLELSHAERSSYECDVVFAGHYEPDGRELYIRALVAAGLHVRLFSGEYWTKEVLGELFEYFSPIRPVYGIEYTKALCGAKMCLAFLSRMNRDTYTRRCFEIPACGRLLLSERTADLKRMFREDEEAVYYSNPQELIEKALWLKSRPGEVSRIAEAGRKRVWADGHDLNNRMREMIQKIDGVLK
jgi:spore maturation protein CgeB